MLAPAPGPLTRRSNSCALGSSATGYLQHSALAQPCLSASMSPAAQQASTGVAEPNASNASWGTSHTLVTNIVVPPRLYLSALEHIFKAWGKLPYVHECEPQGNLKLHGTSADGSADLDQLKQAVVPIQGGWPTRVAIINPVLGNASANNGSASRR